jgi:hypothetical protein
MISGALFFLGLTLHRLCLCVDLTRLTLTSVAPCMKSSHQAGYIDFAICHHSDNGLRRWWFLRSGLNRPDGGSDQSCGVECRIFVVPQPFGFSYTCQRISLDAEQQLPDTLKLLFVSITPIVKVISAIPSELNIPLTIRRSACFIDSLICSALPDCWTDRPFRLAPHTLPHRS